MAQRLRAGGPMQSEHFHFARIGRRQSFANFDGSGLPGAVGAEQTEAFTRAHFQIETVYGDHVFVGLAKLAHAKGGLRGVWRHRNSMADAMTPIS